LNIEYHDIWETAFEIQVIFYLQQPIYKSIF